ncbi:hypothetical protein H5410_009377 [Solanum commersonii]|uniref:Folate transporter 1, chloroplastic n=1 Tax=Solanum commersonii TaxID=4109 RepID=A0A9J6AJG5_SOLCO|nr:hypothetical protein H5410_009377 [Solanum commersonii]
MKKMAALPSADWEWENATAGAAAGLATVTFSHPLDVVRTRFQVYDGGISNVPAYRNTPHALFAIARSEGLRGLYAGFYPAVLGSTISWGLYFFFYSKAKQRYLRNREELSPGLHLASAAEAGALVCFCTNPIWLVKTRLQLQTPNQIRPYTGFHDALRTIIKDEGWRALYKGLMPSLFLITHGAIQFTAYEEFRKVILSSKAQENENPLATAADLLSEKQDDFIKALKKVDLFVPNKREHYASVFALTFLSQDSVDYATLGASSKLAAILTTYPFQVVRSRLQQRPSTTGVPRYMDSWHVVKETARFEGVRGFYRGITANVLKNAPAASITFIVYENVLNLLKMSRREY